MQVLPLRFQHVRKLKKFFFALLHATRVIHLVAWLNRNRVGILCYHSVTGGNQPLPEDPHKLHLPLSLFLQQLDYLQANFRIVSLSELLAARREGRKLPSYSRVLTFDDGFRNFATVVAPQLLSRKFAATSFLVTERSNHVNGANGFHGWSTKDDHSPLSWKEVTTLADKGLEFGSHTSSHPRLLNLSPADARREFEQSRTAIIEQIGKQKIPLSYPHGQTSAELSRLAESVGYSCGLTTALGLNDENTDLFALRRIVIASDDDLATFAARVSGLTWWTGKLLRPLRATPAGVSEQSSYSTPIAEELDILNRYEVSTESGSDRVSV